MSKKDKDEEKKYATGKPFTSDARIYKHGVPVFISDTMLGTCEFVQNQFKGQEFSMLCMGKFEDDGFHVDDKFAIPNQVVTGASVDFTDTEELEKLRTDGFNVIIHSHPFSQKSTSFSPSDRDTLSVNYDYSILFSGGEFTTSTVRITFGPENDYLLILDSEVRQQKKYFSAVAEMASEKIKTKVYQSDFQKGESVHSCRNKGGGFGRNLTNFNRYILPALVAKGRSVGMELV